MLHKSTPSPEVPLTLKYSTPNTELTYKVICQHARLDPTLPVLGCGRELPPFTYVSHRLETLPPTLVLDDLNADWNLDGFTLRDPNPLESVGWT